MIHSAENRKIPSRGKKHILVFLFLRILREMGKQLILANMSDIRIRGDLTLPIQVSIVFITENQSRRKKGSLKSNDSNISIYSPLLQVLIKKKKFSGRLGGAVG